MIKKLREKTPFTLKELSSKHSLISYIEAAQTKKLFEEAKPACALKVKFLIVPFVFSANFR
jgi:hypothetical protein